MASIRRRKYKDRVYIQLRWECPVEGRLRTKTAPDEDTAQIWKRDIEAAARQGKRWGVEEPQPAEPRRDPDLEQMMEAWVQWLARGKAPATVRAYARALDLFVRWMKTVRYPHAQVLVGDMLNKRLMREWYDATATNGHGHPRANGSRRKLVSLVIQWWEWAHSEEDYRAHIPAPVSVKTIGMKKAIRMHTRAPTFEQMDACIRAASGWQRKLYIVLRCTGLRVQQAMGLRWDDIDFETGILRIRPELGKTDAEKAGRWVPIAPALLDVLKDWTPTRDGYLVPCGRKTASYREQRLARSRDARRAWDRAGVPREVTKLPHHAFRSGLVSGLKRLGADDEAVEVLVGHSLGLRGLYTDPDALPMREAVNLIPPFPPDIIDGGKVLPFKRARSAG